MAVIPGLEGLVESQEAIPVERLRHYLDVLESAAEAREAGAARLRAQIRDTAKRHPGLFSPVVVGAGWLAAGGGGGGSNGSASTATKNSSGSVVKDRNGKAVGVGGVTEGESVTTGVSNTSHSNDDDNDNDDSNSANVREIEENSESKPHEETSGDSAEVDHGAEDNGGDAAVETSGVSDRELGGDKEGSGGGGVGGLAGMLIRTVLGIVPGPEPHQEEGAEKEAAAVGVVDDSSPGDVDDSPLGDVEDSSPLSPTAVAPGGGSEGGGSMDVGETEGGGREVVREGKGGNAPAEGTAVVAAGEAGGEGGEGVSVDEVVVET